MALKFSSPNTLTGIALDDRGMTAAQVRRAGARIEVRRVCQASLALDPLTGDPELVGREIRNRLNEAGIREKRCVVTVPLRWALTVRAQIPELSEADQASFLQVQADREFPFPAEDLSVAVSRYRVPGGPEYALLSALPVRHLAAIQKALKAAGLHPVSVTLGITSLVRPDPEAGAVTLLAGEQGVDLLVTAGGGVAALRSLKGPAERGREPEWDADEIIRQLRITLGQLPASLRETIRPLRILGPDRIASALAGDLKESAASVGLRVEKSLPDNADRIKLKDARAFPAIFAAAERLLGKTPVFEFLPPRVGWIERAVNRVSARATFWGAAAAIFVVLGVAGAFLVQGYRLGGLEKRWQAVGPRVEKIEAIQEEVRTFRPWFDDSVQSLSIARKIAEAFPEEGSVWVKTIDIKGMSKVTCTGSARGDEGWLGMLEKLRNTQGVKDLQVLQVRGGSPVQFTLSFQWNGGFSDGLQ